MIFKRGKDESRAPMPVELPVTNNIILQKGDGYYLKSAYGINGSTGNGKLPCQASKV